MLWIRISITLLALALVVSTIMPLVRGNEWWIRGFDFPRFHACIFILIVLAAYAVVVAVDARRDAFMPGFSGWRLAWLSVPIALGLALAWQSYRIFPYTPLAAREMEDAAEAEPERSIRLLTFNVRYDNRDTEALLRLVEEVDPDAILLAEPTHRWAEALEPLHARYPHRLEQPQENHYGMLLFSRLELIDPQVRFMVEDEVPSVHTGLRLPSGDVVSFYGLHPKPPGLKRPRDDQRADSDQRDAELLSVAKEIHDGEHARGDGASDDQPVIVAGDFNDVAWSHTTRLFRRTSGLLDPRIGRGLYNSYDARSTFYRFPIDHVFASDHFRLVDMRILPESGSDHHPVLVELSLQPAARIMQDEPDPQGDDLEEAERTIEEGKQRAQDRAESEPGS